MPPEQQAFVNLPREQMIQIQTILQQQSYYRGLIDGAYGGQTAAAVQGWQRANGFRATGYMDGPQLGALLKAAQPQPADAAAPSAAGARPGAPAATAAAAPPAPAPPAPAPPAPAPPAAAPPAAAAAPVAAPKIDDDSVIYVLTKEGKVAGPKDSLIWHGGEEPKFIKPAYESAITPATMRIRPASTGAEVVWVYDEGDFAISFSSEKCGGATIDKICMVQSALHDFDGDGRPEIVVTIGDGATHLRFWVLQYFRPAAPASFRAKKDYWTVLFEGEGQRELDLQDGRIIVPMGSRGDYDEYNLVGRKFIKRPPP
jgi:hypothetical protein